MDHFGRKAREVDSPPKRGDYPLRLMCLLVKDLRGCKAWVPAGGVVSVARYGNPEKKKTPVLYNVQELIHQA